MDAIPHVFAAIRRVNGLALLLTASILAAAVRAQQSAICQQECPYPVCVERARCPTNYPYMCYRGFGDYNATGDCGSNPDYWYNGHEGGCSACCNQNTCPPLPPTPAPPLTCAVFGGCPGDLQCMLEEQCAGLSGNMMMGTCNRTASGTGSVRLDGLASDGVGVRFTAFDDTYCEGNSTVVTFVNRVCNIDFDSLFGVGLTYVGCGPGPQLSQDEKQTALAAIRKQRGAELPSHIRIERPPVKTERDAADHRSGSV